MFAAKKLTFSTDMSGYLSDRVYDGKRSLSANDVARRKNSIKQAADAVKEQNDARKR